jgi:hypothetical protein
MREIEDGPPPARHFVIPASDFVFAIPEEKSI